MFPKEIWQNILRKLSIRELLAAKLISRQLCELSTIVILAKYESYCKKNKFGRHLKSKIILIHNYVGKIDSLDDEEIIICAFNSAHVAQNDAITRAISQKFKSRLIVLFLAYLFANSAKNMLFIDALPPNIFRLIQFIYEIFGADHFIDYLLRYRCWDSEISENISFRILAIIDSLEYFRIQLKQSRAIGSHLILKKINRMGGKSEICL